MKPFVKAHKGGWVAYRSFWAYLRGREPVLREQTWAAMSAALEGLQKREGRAVLADSAPLINSVNERKDTTL